MLVIGLMSGTSADGVDAALVEWGTAASPVSFELRGFHSQPFDAELQNRIHELAAGRVPGGDSLREFARLDVELAERFADAALEVMKAAGVRPKEVRAVASHGQTVGHFPEDRATLQIGDPSVIAERTGCTTVADFRPRDIAAGGEGAPLAPFFHWAALSSSEENRIALNLGGIANLTWLPKSREPDAVVAFDVGPANALMDGVVQCASAGRERMDRDGARARAGVADEALLAQLLDDEFLRLPPPKSTGRERYGSAEAESLEKEWRSQGRETNDLVRTLAEFTAEAVARACREHLPAEARRGEAVGRVLVCGGGAANPLILAELARRMPASEVTAVDEVGVPAQAVEAMAFSLMGRNAILGEPNHLPSCSGAHRAAVLGEIVPGASGRV